MNGYVFEITLEGSDYTPEALDRLADALVDMCEGTGLLLDSCIYGRRRGCVSIVDYRMTVKHAA